MTIDERALLLGLVDRIEDVKNGLLKTIDAVNSINKEVAVLADKINSIIEISNSHGQQIAEIREALTSHEVPPENEGYIH